MSRRKVQEAAYPAKTAEGVEMEKDRNCYRTAVLFFGIEIVLHLLGYFTNYLYFFGWLMWIPVIVLSVLAVVRILKDKYIVNPYISRKKIYLSSQFILCIFIAVYVIFNICYNCYILRNGGGEYTDGIYYLINLGERVREITSAEYSRLLLAEYRLFTGHILIFYALNVLFFKLKLMEEEV